MVGFAVASLLWVGLFMLILVCLFYLVVLALWWCGVWYCGGSFRLVLFGTCRFRVGLLVFV